MTKLNYEVQMERFWGLKETVSVHANVNDAIKALQVKKHAINNPEVVFTIITVVSN